MIKDGWHELSENTRVYTEDGMVMRAITNGRSASAYKYDARLSCWTNACPVKYETFRRGYREDRYTIK